MADALIAAARWKPPSISTEKLSKAFLQGKYLPSEAGSVRMMSL